MEIDILTVAATILTAGGGGAVVAYGLFKRLSDSWLEAKFAERLEAFRHEKAKELERLRAEIDGALKAQVRYQERQFEACIQVWNALKDAQSKLLSSISPLQQYADIRGMDDSARREYLGSLELPQWQVTDILNASDVQEHFKKTINRLRLHNASVAFSEFDQITRSYELFFVPETFELIRSVCDAMHSSLVAKEIGLQAGDHKMVRDAWKTYEEECVPKVKLLVSQFRELLTVAGSSE